MVDITSKTPTNVSIRFAWNAAGIFFASATTK
jgi:hypothetical protein